MKKTLLSIILVLAIIASFTSTVAFAGEETIEIEGAPYVATTSDKLQLVDGIYYTNNQENGFTYILKEGSTHTIKYSTEKEGTYTEYDGNAINTEGTYYFKESSEGEDSEIVTVVVDYTAPTFTAFDEFVANNWASFKIAVSDEFVAPAYTAEEGVTVFVEYAKAGSSLKDGWSQTLATNKIDLSLGYCAFRYVLKDNAGNETKSDTILRYVTDSSAPEVDVDELASESVVAGNSYTVKTPDITDNSAYTSYYMVSKDGTVIYNSDTNEKAEGYEKMFATAKQIATTEKDGGSKLTITFYVTDTYGNKAEAVTYDLTIKIRPVTDVEKAFGIWQYILIAIAIAAAIGIVLVAVIQPKKQESNVGGRVHYAKEDVAEEIAPQEATVEQPAEEPATEAVEELAPQAEEETSAEEQTEEQPAEEPTEEQPAEEPKTEE